MGWLELELILHAQPIAILNCRLTRLYSHGAHGKHTEAVTAYIDNTMHYNYIIYGTDPEENKGKSILAGQKLIAG